VPRIYDSSNDPIDFCREDYPEEADAEEQYGDVAKTGAGPDGRGNCFSYDAEHPAYEGECYHCVTCGKLLDSDDD
jgi:hypothetical protein